MTERVLKCPHCNAPLAPPSRLSREVACGFCGATVILDTSAVSVARFRQALAEWNDPERFGHERWSTVAGAHYARLRQLARGDSTDVFVADRARVPTERVLLKLARGDGEAKLLRAEWEALQILKREAGEQLGAFAYRLPRAVALGEVSGGAYQGRLAMVQRWAFGFHHTLEEVRARHGAGVDPRAGVWIWRRVLELLTVLHRTGLVHGALLPAHLLLEDGEHGVRLVGFSAAAHSGEPLRTAQAAAAAFYPRGLEVGARLEPGHDLVMAARCVAYALGAPPGTVEVPGQVPDALAELLREVDDQGAPDPWDLRERVGAVGARVFGKPEFVPVSMPSTEGS